MQLKNIKTEMRPVASIKVDRETRQRTTLDKDIDNLAEQIGRVGQIHPIVIHDDGRLVAGERRLEAHKRLGYTEIRCTIFEQLPHNEAYLIELQENLARKQLPWQDEAKAILNYHNQKTEQIPGWTQLGTSNDIGIATGPTSLYLAVAKRLNDPDVAACQTLQGAFNLLRGRAERNIASAQNRGLQIANVLPEILPAAGTKEERTAALQNLLGTNDGLEQLMAKPNADPFAILDSGRIAEASLRKQAEVERVNQEDDVVQTADFLQWAEAYNGPKFDVLHVDFPYGKNYTGANTRKTGKAHIAPRYKDDPDVYWTLLEAFLEHQDKFTFPIAHCIFWFDMDFYQPTRESFEAAGWRLVQPHPLIWTKPYQGVAADTKRRPRHCYETALLLSRGDRKLVKLDQDYYEMRTDEKLHINQKPVQMLKHFLRMIVDEHSAVFDPTCGSGTALSAAKLIGAARILGLELDPSNAEVARYIIDRPVLEALTDAQ